MKRQPPGFYITRGSGFHITFENGWTVSVQFGPGNYCQHRDRHIGDENATCGKEGSQTAEVAYWPSGGDLQRVKADSEIVSGYQTPKQVLALLVKVAVQKQS